MKTFPVRLQPDQDLKHEIDHLAKQRDWSAGCIISAVGSLTSVAIRYANRKQPDILNGYYEIISLSGTVSRAGSHIHIVISDENGKTLGGHLMAGSTIYTTAEIIFAVIDEWEFSKEKDPETGHQELQVTPRDSHS